ncbi:MAG TPA: SRPBCC family protein [Candidatus Limnocylindrales bacterium]|nr:SRPBCC family protein [Candidatus Limnocylindrales bacterium]
MIQWISRALGWFSLALGIVQLVAPRRLLGAIGIVPSGISVTLTRLIGLRELGVVGGLLSASTPVGWLSARVLGDVKDLALLGIARGHRGNDRGRLAVAMAAVGSVLALDAGMAIAARRRQREQSRRGGRIVRAVTVNRERGEVYRFWRDLENLPTVMPHLERVEALGDGTRSHWVARAPIGGPVEWDAEIVDDRRDELIAWRSVEGSEVHHAGAVRFATAPGGRGTEVVVEMDVEMPGGPLGSIVALAAGEDPRQQVSDALRRFKQVMETGEPVRSEGTAHGRKILQRPAQPPREEQHERRLPVVAGSAGDAS